MERDRIVTILAGAAFFEHCTREQVEHVVELADVLRFDAGERVFEPDEPAFFLLVEGELEILRQVGADEVVLVRAQRPGSWGGTVPWVPGSGAVAGRACAASTVLRLSLAATEHLLVEGVPIAPSLLRGLDRGVRELGARTNERERLASLGKLAAGLNHELNNPAAAAARATAQLRDLVAALDADVRDVLRAGTRPEVLDAIAGLVAPTGATPDPIDPLARADAEDQLGDRLAEAGVDEPYVLAGELSELGLTAPDLDGLLVDGMLEPATVRWLVHRAQAVRTMATLSSSVDRIVELVSAIKRFSRMGRAHTIEAVDVHQGLEATLTVLGHALRGITVVRDYGEEVPTVPGNEGELNQVWTNLIDNAADALAGSGTITVRTRVTHHHVVVEIEDDGPGIPDEVLPHVFEPFFTTKPAGDGLGVGLDTVHGIVTKHHGGDVTVETDASGTTFRVTLPRQAPESQDLG